MGRDMWPSFTGMLELGALNRICTLQRIHKDRWLKKMEEPLCELTQDRLHQRKGQVTWCILHMGMVIQFPSR
jgi:hypothetical protein